jgi:hypothetical protein
MVALVLHGNISAISGNSAQYREFAEECERLAKQIKTDGERKILEEMAEAWRRVAAEADNEC